MLNRTAATKASKAHVPRLPLSAAERLDGTAIQTVGAKGYDGSAIAIVGWSTASIIEERLREGVTAKQEGIGNMAQRRQVDVGNA